MRRWFEKQNYFVKCLFYSSIFSLLMSSIMNVAFYKYIISLGLQLYLIIFCFFILFFNYLAIFFLLLNNHLKYFACLLFFLSIFAEYYMVFCETPISPGVIKSIFETNFNEAFEILELKLIVFCIFIAIMMLFIFSKIKLPKVSSYKTLLIHFGGCILFFSLGFLLIGFNYSKLSVFAKQSIIGYYINIDNFLFGTFKVGKKYFQKPKVLKILDENPFKKNKNKNHFVVLFVGETSRKSSFSLNGYQRKTNPMLEKQDIVNFKYATSCGTYTAYSLPCMFSFKTRKRFKESELNENVLQILVKAGVDVTWYENDDNSSKNQAKGKGIEYINLRYEKSPLCDKKRCYDEIALQKIENEIVKFSGKIDNKINLTNNNKKICDKNNSNTFAIKDKIVVFHMIGSHGPLYYKRYPRKWAKFQPECMEANPSVCSVEELKNAYDNTILYQDFILSETIDLLREMKKKHENIDISMIYVSDHGESLGEKGAFLHAFPYALAPKEQTEIPFIIWTSNNVLKNKFLSFSDKSVSHDNLSHTLLGIFDISSVVKDDKLDLTNL